MKSVTRCVCFRFGKIISVLSQLLLLTWQRWIQERPGDSHTHHTLIKTRESNYQDVLYSASCESTPIVHQGAVFCLKASNDPDPGHPWSRGQCLYSRVQKSESATENASIVLFMLSITFAYVQVDIMQNPEY